LVSHQDDCCVKADRNTISRISRQATLEPLTVGWSNAPAAKAVRKPLIAAKVCNPLPLKLPRENWNQITGFAYIVQASGIVARLIWSRDRHRLASKMPSLRRVYPTYVGSSKIAAGAKPVNSIGRTLRLPFVA
jgi:hypothetical protein